MMNEINKIMDIYKKLKSDLEQKGININDVGVSNLIVLSLSEAFGEGVEIGKIKVMKNIVDSLQEKINNQE